MKRVHFIAIGGSAMHNLAIALQREGIDVTGSDDEIFEPSRSRLANLNLLPDRLGWRPEMITEELHAVILGMHARSDNPELKRAQELGIPVYSFPSYIHEQTKDKKRVVIGGSHGKTTITSMVIHVLRAARKEFDYLVGAQLDGFDCMVKLSPNSKVAVIEGDEYLSSALEPVPKFHLYRPDVALISGIAWDHINVFKTYESYVEQFSRFIELIGPGGTLVYCAADPEVVRLAQAHAWRTDVLQIPYGVPPHVIRDGVTFLATRFGEVELNIFGKHNLMNLEGARHICAQLGVSEGVFYEAIGSFLGAARRLEKVAERDGRVVYKDFAHSPSKLEATIAAVRDQFPDRELIACMELHTFSSLREEFLQHYAGTMNQADAAMVFYDPHAAQLKRLPLIPAGRILAAFARPDLQVVSTPGELAERLRDHLVGDAVLLLMSSGSFGGLDLASTAAAFVA